MMRVKMVGMSLFACVLWTGCATVFTGTYDEIHITSEPEGARIFIDGLEEGRTPAVIDVQRAGVGDTEVTLRLEGYEPYTFTLREEFNAVSVINLLSPLAWAIDIATGAVTKYNPLGYDIELIPENQAFRMEDLQLDEQGRYIIPAQEHRVVVKNPALGMQLVFEKQ
ncbi:MAG: PEGA domain-containing protein [Rhodothermales bacterium]